MSTSTPTAATARDLTDAEFAELDELLAAIHHSYEACDAVMLDGFLCGVLVQPVLLEPQTWLPHVFNFEGHPLPDEKPTDAAIPSRSSETATAEPSVSRAMIDNSPGRRSRGWPTPSGS